jgi:hypothetical protein
MGGRPFPHSKMRAMKTICFRSGTGARMTRMNGAPLLTVPRLTLAAVAALAVALFLTACENVGSYTQPTLVRVIDASYLAPAVNVTVNGTLIAANIGQGAITAYGALPASNSAVINVNATTAGPPLLTTNDWVLAAGDQHSAFLTDDAAAPTGYEITVLQDQQVAAATGHSAFRFLNQAINTGAVDVYMVPAGSTLANAIPLVTALPVGNTPTYVSFLSQTVTMVITPTGLTTPSYTSTPIGLTGGEVRTVLIVDTQLTSNPPVAVFTANDVN